MNTQNLDSNKGENERVALVVILMSIVMLALAYATAHPNTTSGYDCFPEYDNFGKVTGCY